MGLGLTLLFVEDLFEKRAAKMSVGMGILMSMAALILLACYFLKTDARTTVMMGFFSVGMMIRFIIHKHSK